MQVALHLHVLAQINLSIVWMVWTFGGRGKSHFGRHFSSLIPDRISSSSPPLPAVRLASIQQMIKVGWVCMPSLSLSGHGRRPTDMTGANWTNWRCDKGITRLISSRASILQTEVEGVTRLSHQNSASFSPSLYYV